MDGTATEQGAMENNNKHANMSLAIDGFLKFGYLRAKAEFVQVG